ncbi:MAG: 3-deoxy-manno-octulosonate cytidylyltransferase [Burkholderiaceae bacterium]|nr:3-deoxy-manno-octulosonate cytidylyltransferase [Burkholderiaceae bacterium]
MSAETFVALIPARLASTRLPDKPLADIAGLPMVVRVAQRAQASGAARVVIATDSHEVARVARGHGVETLMTRSDHRSGTDRLAEAAQQLGLDADTTVVNVQGDEPEMPPALIAAVARRLRDAPDCAIATAAHPIATLEDYLDPNVVKVTIDRAGRAIAFSRAPLPFHRDALRGFPARLPAAMPAELRAAPALRHIGIYAYRVSFLLRFPELEEAAIERAESLEQLRAIWHGFRIAVVLADEAPAAGVDTPEDLARVRARFV